MITCIECKVSMTFENYGYGHDCEFNQSDYDPEDEPLLDND
jgi:uncharacterized CHY-type Zn-finger protein